MGNGTWNIAYDAHKSYGSQNFDFGTQDTGIVLPAPPDIVFPDMTLDDAPLPLEDGVRFGRDTAGGTTLTFTANVLTGKPGHDNEASSHVALNRFRKVWDAAGLRNTPGAVATLSSKYGGVKRYMFGRPRRWAPGTGAATPQGVTPVVFDFQCADSYFYDAQQAVSSTARRANLEAAGDVTFGVGGSVFANRLKWSFKIHVDGSHATQPVIVINGPIRNPTVRFGDAFTVALNMTISDSAQVTIDPRKWVRTVLRHDGASVANALDRSSATMQQMVLTPDTYVVTVAGHGINGGATNVTVKWRDAYSYL